MYLTNTHCPHPALVCGVRWMVEISGCSVQDVAWLVEIPVVCVVSNQRGVKIFGFG